MPDTTVRDWTTVGPSKSAGNGNADRLALEARGSAGQLTTTFMYLSTVTVWLEGTTMVESACSITSGP